MEKLKKQDLETIHRKGLSEEDIQQQLNNFYQGFAPVPLVRPATPQDGIVMFDQDELDQFKIKYGKNMQNLFISKFVPASGAASRMFKPLYEYLEDGNAHTTEIKQFIKNITHFAFYGELKTALKKKGVMIDHAIYRKDYQMIIQELLEPRGLGYGQLPKALIKFHRYQDHVRTPVEEHMVEGAGYAINSNNTVRIHYTILSEHKKAFESLINQKNSGYEEYLETKFQTDYSFQDESTDRIAVDQHNKLLRDPDGSLLFRPGGHGALLNNLNKLQDELIFIKNIDNVVPDKYKVLTYDYKKALAGFLLAYQQKIFDYLYKLDEQQDLSENVIDEMMRFLEKELNVIPPDDLEKNNTRGMGQYLYRKFNRPIRVCGMVKNQGEVGGGPFWVKEKDGSVSLQIIEKSQIDIHNPGQKAILEESTHFNPVDLVCGIKDYKGIKFDLFQFRDPSMGIITHKSRNGKPMKVQELPGLWNGGMAYWNTLFVEVPLITFNPVKSVMDLLRDEHQ